MKSELPLISVVITAHDRKKYLINAVNSILAQTLKRDIFEIIVVKNFKDQKIDEYFEREGIKSVFTEENSFGAKLAIGMKVSRGDIISFLDDDDSFTNNKLEVVLGNFKDNAELNYFHNGIQEMNEEGFTVRNMDIKKYQEPPIVLRSPIEDLSSLSKLSKFRGDWYMSCISIKRNSFIPFIDFIGSTSASLDRIIFIISLNLTGKIILEKGKLTKYRMHQSTTGIRSEFDDYCNKKKTFFRRTLNSIKAADSLPVINNISKQYIAFQKVHNEANNMLYDVNSNRLHRAGIFVSCMRVYYKLKDRIYLLLSFFILLSIISPRMVIFMHYLYQNSRISF